jgi:hypothetical protein
MFNCLAFSEQRAIKPFLAMLLMEADNHYSKH